MDASKKQKQPFENKWLSLLNCEKVDEGRVQPLLSVVICTFDCAESIGMTLESLALQDYPKFELLIIDANSQDRSLSVIQSFKSLPVKIYSVTDYTIHEMMNRGISLCEGDYVHFMFPADTYLSPDVFKHMMNLAVEQEFPDLLYSGCVLRGEHKSPKIFLRDLDSQTLKMGRQPTCPQALWFRVETLKNLGKFDGNYSLRASFELLCRYMKEQDLRIAASKRIFIDYEPKSSSPTDLILHNQETFSILRQYFGLFVACKWWFLKGLFRFFKWWLKSLKIYLWKKRFY